jgi:hypothetical protein
VDPADGNQVDFSSFWSNEFADVRSLYPIAILLVGGISAHAADATRAESIRKLASENYAERVEATQALWAEGEVALEDLKEASRSRDPEMALRARDLLRKIDLGIAPDTDPRIINLTERYQSANQIQKTTIFQELQRLRAWRQILRLYANETDASTRENLERRVDGIALHAARERIAVGDQNGALEYLEMARNTPNGLISIAAFHRARGTLEKEIEAVGEPTEPQEMAWLTALYRAADDSGNAAAMARASGDGHLAAAMDMLGGNPLPWLNHAAATADKNQAGGAANYANAAAARWRGEASIPELQVIRRKLRSHDEAVRLSGESELFLLGETDAAWKSFTHHYPEEAFANFDALERIDDALTVLGLDPVNPDFKGYLTPLLAKVCQAPGAPGKELDDDEVRDDHVRKLVTFCNFLEKRGRYDVLDELVAPALLEFGEVHAPRFTDLLSELFASPASSAGAPELAMRVAEKWAGDDKQRWGEMMIAAFGEEHGYPQWWELLEKIAPESSHAERLGGMLAIFGYSRDSANLYDAWLDATWKYIEKAEDPAPALQAMEFLASNISDLEFIEKLREINAGNVEDDDDGATYGNLLVDTAVGRWGEAADMFLLQIAALAERGDARAELHAYATACLRKAGRFEEADAHELWVETLALGDFRANLSIAQAFAFGRDYPRATRWYRRAVMESHPNDNRFKQVLRVYVNELLHQQDYKLTAACSEVLAQLEAVDTNFGFMPFTLTRLRQQADFSRALSLPPGQSDEARRLLRQAHAIMPTDGALADHFFPSLLESPFTDLHNELFEISWRKITASLELFPNADNTMNTAVWFASRSARRLEEAKKLQQKALERHPRSPAYLDTLAEVYFAMGNRPEAIRFGALSVRFMPHDSMIIRQYERFLHGAMPVK